jgi:hypothetical protein
MSVRSWLLRKTVPDGAPYDAVRCSVIGPTVDDPEPVVSVSDLQREIERRLAVVRSNTRGHDAAYGVLDRVEAALLDLAGGES